ncbi:MAG: hypothetical protein OS112_05890 [Methanoregula sp.]|nr:MAG: hypothetical protein OS112_05890 [Methanoregula sp.]
MAKMISPPQSRATGVGALPHTDPKQACADVLSIFPEFPYVPTLPERGQKETIVYTDSEQLPGRMIRENRLIYDSTAGTLESTEKIYSDYLETNFEPYGLHYEFGSGFTEMMDHDLSSFPILKCQVTGPVTFGMQVVDTGKRPIYYDAQLADMVAKLLALRSRWCEVEMQKKTGVKETLVVLNEPYLASLGSSVVPIDPETVRSGWQDIASLVQGGLGIHCCSNTDWEFVIDLKPSVISIDAFATAKEFLLFGDTIAGYMERGGVIAWGIVPADFRLFSNETVDSLYARYLTIRAELCTRIPVSLFDRQSIVTPSCGIRFADRSGALAIMQAAGEISSRIKRGRM